MKFIAQFIHKPIFAIVLSILIVLVGLFGSLKLPIRFLPKINQAYINIHTTYPGANSEIVKNFVTSKIQNAIVGIQGIDYITSTSTTGDSNIGVYLDTDTNPDNVLSGVLGKVSGIQNQLPVGIQTPAITKNNLDSNATMILAFTSNSVPRADIAEYLRRIIEPKLETIDGVSQAQVWADDYAMQIWLDPLKMSAYQLFPTDIVNSLNKYNILSTPGQTRGNYFDYSLSLNSDLHKKEDFNNIPVKINESGIVYLRDVGYAKTGSISDDFMVYFNAKPAVMVAINILDNANPLSVSKLMLQALPEIRQDLPQGIEVNVVLNQADAIYSSLYEVLKTLIEAVIIVVLVVFLFLGNLRVAMIPAIAIPLSLLGVIFLMDMVGYSINTITMLAFVVSIGLVVDDAIVVVENVVRHLKNKQCIIDATIIATSELLLPIIAMTITLATVYSPIKFVGGITGQLFVEFAFTLACSVIISGIVSLCLSPVLCTKLLTTNNHNKIYYLMEKLNSKLQGYYGILLHQVIKFKYIFQVVWILIISGSIYLYVSIPREFMPKESLGFLVVTGEAKPNANTEYLKYYANMVHKVFAKFSDIGRYSSMVSPSDGFLAFIVAKTSANGDLLPLANEMYKLQSMLDEITGLSLRVVSPSGVAGGGPSIKLVLKSTGSYDELYRMAKKIELTARQSHNFLYIFDDLQYNKAQANIVVNRAELNAYNIPMSDVADTISNLMSNNQVQYFSQNSQSYWVVIKTIPEYQLTPTLLQSIPIQVNNSSVPLSAFASVNYTVVPSSLNQFQKMNSVTISAEMNSGKTVSQGLHVINNIIAMANLPTNISVDYSGSLRQYIQEGNKVILIFSIAIIIIFLVLSLQFASFRDSLIILLGSIPMALFSSLLALKLFGLTVNIYTQIGLLTLIGLISKHGILIIRYANDIRKNAKVDKQTAIIEACIIRFRPVVMTSVAIIWGTLPLVFASGVGMSSRHSMGIIVDFGIGIGTVLTLLLFPIVYLAVTKKT